MLEKERFLQSGGGGSRRSEYVLGCSQTSKDDSDSWLYKGAYKFLSAAVE